MPGSFFLTGVDGTRGANVARNENRAAWLYLNRLSTVNSTDSGLVFQSAWWDIVHDNGDGLSTGLVQ